MTKREPDLDIVIPVYNEGENIVRALNALKSQAKSQLRILVVYDLEKDTTLAALAHFDPGPLEIISLKNIYEPGPHGAVRTGFYYSKNTPVIMMPADDDYNASIIDLMLAKHRQGNEIVVASRFIPGGTMQGCSFLKSLLVRISSFTLFYIGGLPVHDATNGFRLFSRRLLTTIPLESTEGFTFSLELLVKCHRLGWPMAEVPAQWFQRQAGTSRFKVLKWLRPYLTWYWYGFATTFLRKGAASVKLSGQG